MFSSFHFLRPLWLFLLIIPVIGYRYFFASRRNISAWEAICDKNLLNFLLVKGNSKQRSFIGYAAIIGLICGIAALSGPSWQKKETPVFSPLNPVMILLNMSSDMDNTDLQPNRLSRAKFVIDDLLKDIQAQTGLIVYTNEPFLISPITEDKGVISNLLPAVVDDIMPENGDKLYRAIDMAVTKLKEDGYPFGNIIVIAPDIGQDFEKALSSASLAADRGYKINVIAARADSSEKLSLLASRGKGSYVDIKNILPLISEINSQISSSMEQSKNFQETWNDNGYWFVFIPLLCLLTFFRRGILIIVFFVMISFSAQAGFFTNQNQDGAKFFADGNFEKAAKSFEHPQWKASALYKQQKYDEALKFFEQDNSIEGIYNQGNALAKSGKIDEAIKKYEEVLAKNPNHEDAKFNLEYLKKQQQQQQEQNQNQQDDSDNQDDKEQNSGDNSEQQNSEDNQKSKGEENQESQDKEQNNDKDTSSQNEQDASSENTQGEQNQQDEQNLQEASEQENSDNKGENKPQSVPTDSSSEKESKQDASVQTVQQQEDVEGDFDEQTQAREMTYRNIPEDAGGLLRAFILKEYNKNRYGDK